MTESSEKQLQYYPGDFDHILEFYKLQVNKIQKIEEIIVSTNNFHMAINASIVTVLGVFFEKGYRLWPILIIGLIASILWYFQLTALRYLRATNYDALRNIEIQLGFSPQILDKKVDITKGWLTELSFSAKDNYLPMLLIFLWFVSIMVIIIWL